MLPDSETQPKGKEPETELKQPVFEIAESGIICFSPPENPTGQEQRLAADIVILDHKSNHQLKPHTRERQEVADLLYNVVSFLQQRDAARGRLILEDAESVYLHHNQTRNRIRYLAGASAGTLFATLLVSTILFFSKLLEPFISSQLLLLLFVFAGMGSLTSVLTRISSIDLSEETSSFSVFVSGFSRPVVAIFLALVVYLTIASKIVNVRFGTDIEGQANAVYLIVGFLCGFSERFATDIISKLPANIEARNESNHISGSPKQK